MRSSLFVRHTAVAIAAALISLAGSGVIAWTWRNQALRAAEDARMSAATARARQAADALMARLRAQQGQTLAAASLPPLRAMLATLRTHDKLAPLVATLTDAFAAESWWEPFRQDGLGPCLALEGTALDVCSDPRNRAVAVGPIVRAAAESGAAQDLVAGQGEAWLVTASRVPLPQRNRSAELLLFHRIDELMLGALRSSPADGLALAAAGEILMGAGPPAARAALAVSGPTADFRVARVPVGHLTLLTAVDATSSTPRSWAGAPTQALLVGSVLAMIFAWLGLRQSSPTSLALRQRGRAQDAEAEAVAPLASGSPVPAADDDYRTRDTRVLKPGYRPGARTVGRYTLIDKLGEGGMAQVFTAVSHGAEGFRRKLVVKRLRPELTDSKEAVSQFIDEAKLGSSLVHSNIVPIFDFGKAGDSYYIAMEYILGRNLDWLVGKRLSRGEGPLPVPIVLYVLAETLKALDYAHTRCGDDGRPLGVVHRDVSPSNIIVSKRGEVKLLDFGIVKADKRATRTEHGVLKGNLLFMAPEQARGQATDARSDLFSLGLVAYFCATGTCLYQEQTTYDLMLEAAAGPDAKDWQALAALPAPLASVLRVALQADPSARYNDAASFAAALAAGPQASIQDAERLVEALAGEELAREELRLVDAAPAPPLGDSSPRMSSGRS